MPSNRQYSDECPPYCTCVDCKGNYVRNYNYQSSGSGIFNISLSRKECPITILLASVNILVLLLDLMLDGKIIEIGAKSSYGIINGEFWRLLTPIFLHADIFHLVTNLFGILVFGSIIEKKLGSMKFVAIYVLSGIYGNTFSFYFSPYLGVGSSGSVFGVLASLLTYFYLNKNMFGYIAKEYLISIITIISISLIFGFISSGIDNAAHLGGILSGLIISLLIMPKHNNGIHIYGSFERSSVVNRIIYKLITNIYLKAFLALFLVLIFIMMITYRSNSGY